MLTSVYTTEAYTRYIFTPSTVIDALPDGTHRVNRDGNEDHEWTWTDGLVEFGNVEYRPLPVGIHSITISRSITVYITKPMNWVLDPKLNGKRFRVSVNETNDRSVTIQNYSTLLDRIPARDIPHMMLRCGVDDRDLVWLKCSTN